MFNLGMGEIVVVLLLALIFLGPKKLPELAAGLGKMIREVRKATAGVKDELHIDESIRKPLQELREAVALPAEELRRIDDERRELEEARRRAAQGSGAEPYGVPGASEAAESAGSAPAPAPPPSEVPAPAVSAASATPALPPPPPGRLPPPIPRRS